ncbi:hypothetical protein G6011_09502 [Alternaria panax]|uniref:Uncharacterized protein n=1 Tax=Alternaria panax TaxID=48097 RepID=A0AAD4IBD9_9PLEO|nr:hypothetical protein G6011_09502 [Alternaria panax]
MENESATDNSSDGGPLHDFSVRVHTVQVGDDGKDEVRGQVIDASGDFSHLGDGVRWIHVPVNNLFWVNACFTKCGYTRMPSKITAVKMRPAFSRRIWPEHARHLEPSCTQGSYPRSVQRGETPTAGASIEEITPSKGTIPLPLLTVYLPYMTWMRYGKFRSMMYTYEESSAGFSTDPDAAFFTNDAAPSTSQQRPLSGTPAEVSTEKDKQSKPDTLQSTSINPKAPASVEISSWPKEGFDHVMQRPSYPRRTLDQFYYPALHNTDARDKDQTISKWSGAALGWYGRHSAATDSAMIMVDQFWCWIIDENTIITSFPSGEYSGCPPNVPDLYWNIMISLSDDPKPLKSVWDMYSLLVKASTRHMFTKHDRNSLDILEIYRWVTREKAATQTTYFQEFQQGYASGRSNNAIFDDRPDLKLVLEVADIIDELKAMDETLMHLLDEITSISNEADHTRNMLLSLLDLKSKSASLAEARSSAKEAQAATTQGRAVMLFTIITVIFLPLSFFTSYFGQNIKELTGDEDNPSTWDLWRVATPITIVVIVVALLVALYITQPSSPLWLWKSSSEEGEEAPFAEDTMFRRMRRAMGWKSAETLYHGHRRSWGTSSSNNDDMEMAPEEVAAEEVAAEEMAADRISAQAGSELRETWRDV